MGRRVPISCSQTGVGWIVFDRAAVRSAAGVLRHELLESRNHGRGHAIKEGLTAFAEKREPQFRGY